MAELINNKAVLGSLGSVGLPFYDGKNTRVKGFYSNIVLQNELDLAKDYIKSAFELHDSNYSTRLSLRMIVENGLKPSILSGKLNEEARIPLDGKWKGYDVLYMYNNDPSRISEKHTLDMEQKMVSDSIKGRKNFNYLKRAENTGYKVEIDKISESDIDDLFVLYNEAFTDYLFDLNRENISGLVMNPECSPVVARHDDKIASIVIAESKKVDISGKEFYICEISDAATKKEHRNKGLNQALFQKLIPYMNDSNVDLIYTESRANSFGVNISKANLGFDFAGRLNKHCVIGGDREIEENGNFENLNVWYMTKK